MAQAFTELNWRERLIVLVLVGGLIIGALAFIISPQTTALFSSSSQWGWDFRNNLWSPTHLLLDGRSPYRIDQLYDANSVWLPPAIGAFLPLGALPLDIAIKTWFIINLGVFFAIVGLSLRTAKPQPILLAVTLIALLLFPPLTSHLLLGQYSLWIVLLSLLAAEGIKRRWSPVLIGVCIALALPKPQLLLLVLPGLCISVIRHHPKNNLQKRFIAAGLWLLLSGIWGVIFTLPLWLGYPNWVEDFLWAMNRNAPWIQPSSLELLRTLTQNKGVAWLLWGIWCVVMLGLTGWLAWHKSPDSATRWILALTPIVTPYVWSWDFVLLLPVMIHTLFACQRWVTRGIWFIGYGIIWEGILQQRLNAQAITSDEHFWWIPYALLVLMVMVSMFNNAIKPNSA